VKFSSRYTNSGSARNRQAVFASLNLARALRFRDAGFAAVERGRAEHPCFYCAVSSCAEVQIGSDMLLSILVQNDYDYFAAREQCGVGGRIYSGLLQW
jgi:hypothetical protein